MIKTYLLQALTGKRDGILDSSVPFIYNTCLVFILKKLR